MPKRPSPSVTLEPLQESDFSSWLDHNVAEFAKDKQRTNGYAPKDALELAKATMDRALNEGLATKDNYIFNAINQNGEKVGAIWFAVQMHFGLRSAFIYDIEIIEPERGNGYGRATMLALEEKVRQLKLDTINLHVFAFNKTALALYQTLGFEITDYSMSKHLAAN